MGSLADCSRKIETLTVLIKFSLYKLWTIVILEISEISTDKYSHMFDDRINFLLWDFFYSFGGGCIVTLCILFFLQYYFGIIWPNSIKVAAITSAMCGFVIYYLFYC